MILLCKDTTFFDNRDRNTLFFYCFTDSVALVCFLHRVWAKYKI